MRRGGMDRREGASVGWISLELSSRLIRASARLGMASRSGVLLFGGDLESQLRMCEGWMVGVDRDVSWPGSVLASRHGPVWQRSGWLVR